MITGTTWQWEETQTPVEKITSPAPDRYTLLLLPDGRANSRFDCNRGGGSYRIVEPGRISFGTMATTMMACPPGSLDRRFAKDLGQAGGYFVEGGKLYLELPADSGTMRFRPGQ
ncbi:MAG TPA: META domain-containing protein [Accumulibacter sp.]|nr:META domain-containing protein [Accumulibacter sp.]